MDKGKYLKRLSILTTELKDLKNALHRYNPRLFINAYNRQEYKCEIPNIDPTTREINKLIHREHKIYAKINHINQLLFGN